jgi:hypothetical protein
MFWDQDNRHSQASHWLLFSKTTRATVGVNWGLFSSLSTNRTSDSRSGIILAKRLHYPSPVLTRGTQSGSSSFWHDKWFIFKEIEYWLSGIRLIWKINGKLSSSKRRNLLTQGWIPWSSFHVHPTFPMEKGECWPWSYIPVKLWTTSYKCLVDPVKIFGGLMREFRSSLTLTVSDVSVLSFIWFSYRNVRNRGHVRNSRPQKKSWHQSCRADIFEWPGQKKTQMGEKTQNQVSKTRIQIRLRSNQGKAGFLRIMLKRKALLTQNLSGVWERMWYQTILKEIKVCSICNSQWENRGAGPKDLRELARNSIVQLNRQ